MATNFVDDETSCMNQRAALILNPILNPFLKRG
jgi:hypothetical protein